MPLQQDLAAFCVRLKIAPDEICFTLPGGAEQCIELDAKSPDIAELVKKGFAQLNSALTPLTPIFNVLDVIVALKNCIMAIPDSIGPPPSPKPILDCVRELIPLVENLLRLLPQYSIPLLIAQILDVLIMLLEGQKAQIQAMIRKTQQIIEAGTRATELGNVEFQALLDCANGNLELEAQNLNASLKPVNRLLGLVNTLADLAGLPCIPSIPDMSELTQGTLDQIDDVIAVLLQIRKLIPIGGIDFGAPGEGYTPCED